MRIRSTKPEFWRSERISSVDWNARLVLKGLESYVDDNGVGKDDIALIVGDVFPRDMARDPRDTLAKVSEAISALHQAGLIHRYEVDGTRLLFVSWWEEVQRIDKPGKGRLPRPDGTFAYGDSKIRDSLARVPGTLAPGTGEQGNRGTGGGRGETPPPTPTCSRHPDGSDRPCAACKRARIEWEKTQTAPAPKTPVVGRAPECDLHPDWPLPCAKCAAIAAEEAA